MLYHSNVTRQHGSGGEKRLSLGGKKSLLDLWEIALFTFSRFRTTCELEFNSTLNFKDHVAISGKLLCGGA